MTDTLATLTDKVQATLGDDGTVFTDALVTAALRLALDDWNERAPVNAASTLAVVADTKEYSVTVEDADSVDVFDVLIRGTDTNQENHIPINFDWYYEDNTIFIRTQLTYSASNYLIIRYTKPNTISGLDSATESTVPENDDPSLVIGGAYYALVLRAASKVETINLQKNVAENYNKLAEVLLAKWNSRLAKASARNAPQVPDTRAWNDSWYGWNK